MEHEFENIRNKVSQAEQNDVAWEKELVWSKITQPEKKHFAVYYAAASLLIASALFFYAYERTKQKEMDLQLKAIELSIEKNKTLQSHANKQPSITKYIDCPAPVAHQEIRSSPKQNKKIKQQEIVTPASTEQPQREEVTNNTVAVIEPMVVTSEEGRVTESNSFRKVQAIIGSNGPVSASNTKDKKLKFRLFIPEENTETPPAAAEAISFHAKIN